MSAELAGARRRWAASAAGALAILTVLMLFLRIPRVPEVVPVPAPLSRPVELDRKVQAKDEAALRDQVPLFLPTERNVTMKPRTRRQAGSALLDQDALKLTFGETDPALRMPEPVTLPEKPAEAVLGDAAPAPLHGLGRADSKTPPLPERGATVEVLTTRTNQRVLWDLLPVEARPPSKKSWRPMEFTARVDAAGLVGSLKLTERSDSEEAENFFSNYLARTFRIGERLSPGIYRVIVAP